LKKPVEGMSEEIDCVFDESIACGSALPLRVSFGKR